MRTGSGLKLFFSGKPNISCMIMHKKLHNYATQKLSFLQAYVEKFS